MYLFDGGNLCGIGLNISAIVGKHWQTKLLVCVGSQRMWCHWVTSSDPHQYWFLTIEKKGGDEKRDKILLFLRKHVQSKRPVFNIWMSCRSSFALSLSRPHHINGLTGGTWKDFKQFLITFTSSLLYFYPWLLSAKMRGLLCIICIFSVSRELCLDSHDRIKFLQIRAFFKTGPIMWELHETASPFYFIVFVLLQKWRKRFWGNICGLKVFPG